MRSVRRQKPSACMAGAVVERSARVLAGAGGIWKFNIADESPEKVALVEKTRAS